MRRHTLFLYLRIQFDLIMKKLSILLLFSAILSFVSAQNPVTEATARKIAERFTQQQMQKADAEITLFSASNLYIYNIGNQGFVIVSGNDALPPIIGYSKEAAFPSLDDAPENVVGWMQHYGDMIDFARKNHVAAEPEIQRQWQAAYRGQFGTKGAKTVDPLVQTRWNQDCYYNEYCPTAGGGWWGGPCGHCYAGCVATAMAQVMKYWDYPAQGFGSHSYIHPTYGEQSADFASTTYAWQNMPNQVYSHNDAVATLLYHCGVSVDMNYAPDGSGAQSADVEVALRSYFGYCGAKYREKNAYTNEEWDQMLRAELDLSHPIYYSGSNGSSGHAFVCDGYDDNGDFHFNFGWSGSADAFYSTYDVNGFNGSQAVVMNIYPVNIQADANGIIYVSADGEGDGSSWESPTSHLDFASALSSGGATKVWVKKGIYYGNENDPLTAFDVTESNRVYGSFNGDEPADYDISQRDFVNNASILDGQGVRRVLTQKKAFNAATAPVWDGFIIRNGNSGTGGGAFIDNYATLSNCQIIDNVSSMFGGGVYINNGGGNAHVILNNCTITGNTASMGGGVCDRLGCDFNNCWISNNTSTTKGAGVYVFMNTEPVFKNCVISNNTAVQGGAIYIRGKVTAYNCNFVMNLGTESIGGAFNEKAHNKYYNCIFWGNMPSQMEGIQPDMEYCAIQDDANAAYRLKADNDGEEPGYFIRFLHPSDNAGTEFRTDTWELQSNSIAINAGKPYTTGLGDYDIAGNPRLQKARIDIGAYESCTDVYKTDAVSCNTTCQFYGCQLTLPGHYTAIIPRAECDSVVSFDLSFSEYAMDLRIEGPNQILPGERAVLTASGADTYLWSTGEATASITVRPTENTVYSVIGYNEEGCEAEVQHSIAVSGTSITEAALAHISVVPNPADSEVRIDAEGLKQVSVYNATGAKMKVSTASGHIDTSAWRNGVYFLHITTENGQFVQKLVVRH